MIDRFIEACLNTIVVTQRELTTSLIAISIFRPTPELESFARRRGIWIPSGNGSTGWIDLQSIHGVTITVFNVTQQSNDNTAVSKMS